MNGFRVLLFVAVFPLATFVGCEHQPVANHEQEIISAIKRDLVDELNSHTYGTDGYSVANVRVEKLEYMGAFTGEFYKARYAFIPPIYWTYHVSAPETASIKRLSPINSDARDSVLSSYLRPDLPASLDSNQLTRFFRFYQGLDDALGSQRVIGKWSEVYGITEDEIKKRQDKPIFPPHYENLQGQQRIVWFAWDYRGGLVLRKELVYERQRLKYSIDTVGAAVGEWNRY